MSGAAEAADAAVAAGFYGENLVIAVAVAGAESGWNPSATHVNTNGSTDYGEWQINSIHAAILRAGTWSNVNDNAIMAHKVWAAAGNSWTPWATYNSGSYQNFMTQARAAVSGTTQTAPTSHTSDVHLQASGIFVAAAVPSIDGVGDRVEARFASFG